MLRGQLATLMTPRDAWDGKARQSVDSFEAKCRAKAECSNTFTVRGAPRAPRIGERHAARAPRVRWAGKFKVQGSKFKVVVVSRSRRKEGSPAQKNNLRILQSIDQTINRKMKEGGLQASSPAAGFATGVTRAGRGLPSLIMRPARIAPSAHKRWPSSLL